MTLGNHGRALAKCGRFEEAEAAYLESVSIKERTLGVDHPETRLTAANLDNLVLVLSGSHLASSAKPEVTNIGGRLLLQTPGNDDDGSSDDVKAAAAKGVARAYAPGAAKEAAMASAASVYHTSPVRTPGAAAAAAAMEAEVAEAAAAASAARAWRWRRRRRQRRRRERPRWQRWPRRAAAAEQQEQQQQQQEQQRQQQGVAR